MNMQKWIDRLDTKGPITLNEQQKQDLVFILKWVKIRLEDYIKIFKDYGSDR